LNKGYSSQKKPDSVYSEQFRDRIYSVDQGIHFSELRPAQQLILKKLAAEYFANFNPGESVSVDSFCNAKLRFFYMDNRSKGKPHYYRMENGMQIIEYENYDNHIHCFWRSTNDFGKEILSNP
jgi:Protein of unknown function (DUF3500)